jgi:hypothetical protein
MKRRLALTFAGTAAIVLTAGSAAVAANLGILSSASKEPVGQLSANTVADLSAPVTTVEPIVVTVDEIVPVPVDPEPTTAAGAVASDDDHEAPDVSSSGPQPRPTTVAPTPTTVRTESSGSGGGDHSGSDDHSGSGGEHEDD